MKELTIAIDGPSGAGKGTIARTVAGSLSYRHVDTGAMYRAVAWKAVHDGLSLEDETAVARLAAHASIEVDDRTSIDGHDVTAAIRTPEIDAAAAKVARLGEVRRVLVERQRRMGRHGGVVMEGRDIGTVVFPQADLKIYLDASPEERAKRRAADTSRPAGAASVEVATALAQRDHLDRTRQASPLAVAADAHIIDTTHLSIDEVVRRVMALVDAVRQPR